MTIVDTTSTIAPALKTIGALLSYNTSNIFSRKEYNKDSANKYVHDIYDAICITIEILVFSLVMYCPRRGASEIMRTKRVS